MRLLAASALLLVAASACAQPAPEIPYVAMNLAAHPDDEDGATMTYLRRAENAAVHSVIFTRGEGGQNETGPELYHALGAIRSRETEAAARELGTQVLFLNFYDFGFSKSASETFGKWGGRDRVTAELVRLIRMVKPDILFTNHDTVSVGPQRQHGHHQAVGIAAFDAFGLAADPTYHPEQLREDGVDLWQPKRLFLRQRRPQPGEAYDASVPVGEEGDQGQSYAADAADALGRHESQGMGQFAARLRRLDATRFRLLRSSEEVETTLGALFAGLVRRRAPDPDLTYLIDSGRIPSLPDDAIAFEDSTPVPGQSVTMRWDPEAFPAGASAWVFEGAIDTTLWFPLDPRGSAVLDVLPDAVPTVPAKTYQYRRQVNHPPVVYSVQAEGTGRLLRAGYAPLEVAPDVHVESGAEVLRLRPGVNRVPFRARVDDPAATGLRIRAALVRERDRVLEFEAATDFALDASGSVADTLELTLPDDLAPGDRSLTLTVLATPKAAESARIELTGRVFDVRVAPGLRVGVIAGYDDALQKALSETGADWVPLDSLDLAHGRFDSLHTIVVDIRGYLVRRDLRAHNDNLLEWVRRGGHLIVNYQKTFEWNAGSPDPFDAAARNPGTFAPYPLALGRGRVTQQDAAVTVNRPDHAVMRRPNAIAPSAWDGWVQERGLYFPAMWDTAYDELFCMSDPGEEPLCGSTLLASYGEGSYLYTALVWYRQLKVFHPGAYALFANMLSLPLTRGAGK